MVSVNDIMDCIYIIRSTSSTNEKKELMKKFFKDFGGTWMKVLLYTYDPLKVFHVKKYRRLPGVKAIKLEAIFSVLDILSERKVTGNKAVQLVEETMQKLSEEDAEVMHLILQKDLKCGINKKLIQQTFDTVNHKCFYDLGYMGAVPFKENTFDKLLKSDVIFSQEKMDGEYSNLIINEEKIEFFSRSNKVQNIPNLIIKKIKKDLEDFKESEKDLFINPLILNGELIIEGYDRYTSNGLLSRIFKYEEYLENNESEKKINKALEKIEEIGQKKITSIYNSIKYYIWDYQDKNTIYKERWKNVVKIAEASSFFKKVDTIICFGDSKNKSILLKHFKDIVSKGGEGTIVKDGNQVWKNGKPSFQIKLKFEFECELRIKGFKRGTKGTEFENSLGSFICESEDGILKTFPSGITRDLRKEIWDNQDNYLNKIITVKCNGLSQSKDNNWSLLHPRFIKFRDDKDKADDFNEIKKISLSIIKLG